MVVMTPLLSLLLVSVLSSPLAASDGDHRGATDSLTPRGKRKISRNLGVTVTSAPRTTTCRYLLERPSCHLFWS